MNTALHIIWNPSEGIQIGSFTLRFYSLMFVIAFSLGYYIMQKIYKKEGRTQDELDKLFIYTFIATLLGARLGHVFFYDWNRYYKDHLLEILLPFKFNPFEFTGFSGLASHGAAIGIIVAMIYYNRKVIIDKPLLWILDRITLPITIGGVFVRLGNFFNSEIIGHETTAATGIRFVRDRFDAKEAMAFTGIDNVNKAYKAIVHDPQFATLLEQVPAKHPTQLYEAFGYILLFVLLYILYWKTDAKKYIGKIFGIFLVFLWTIRFIVEFVKESQGGFEVYFHNVLTTGQWLSIPFILAGIYIWYHSRNKYSETI